MFGKHSLIGSITFPSRTCALGKRGRHRDIVRWQAINWYGDYLTPVGSVKSTGSNQSLKKTYWTKWRSRNECWEKWLAFLEQDVYITSVANTRSTKLFCHSLKAVLTFTASPDLWRRVMMVREELVGVFREHRYLPRGGGAVCFWQPVIYKKVTLLVAAWNGTCCWAL